MTGRLSKNFHGVGIGPLSKILAVNAVFFSSSKELWVKVSIYIFRFVLKKLLVMWLYPGYRYLPSRSPGFRFWHNSPYVQLWTNVSSVVAFQRWWVLKSKLFDQESTCSKEILIPSTLNHLWFSVVGVLKVEYLDFPCEIFEILCELDVGVIACIF